MDNIIKYAKEHLSFNFETGEILWVKYPKKYNKVNKPKEAGSLHYSGYRIICLMNKQYMAHRLIWAVYYNKWPDGFLDHVDGNKSNNCINNLRLATRFQNGYNIGPKKISQSGYKNVQWDKDTNKWRVRVRVDGVRHHVGRFEKIDDAINSAKKFMLEYHKEFAKV